MNLKKIIIYQFDILFQILNEIKKEYNFDTVKADKEVINDLKKNLDDNYLIISQTELDNFKSQLVITKLPIKISKLIEQINLKFLKEKFNSQSDISVGSYTINRNSRKIYRDNKKSDLTEREINLIIYLKNQGKAVKIDELQKKVWEYGSELETHTVETHIYRLRKKIKEKFDDDNFILSSKEGYLIN
tara:strand:- start:1091 stop:1654 length:564 start_codon:yes stop_codon:yes gene_type:complete